MSLILDALEKADADRKDQAGEDRSEFKRKDSKSSTSDRNEPISQKNNDAWAHDRLERAASFDDAADIADEPGERELRHDVSYTEDNSDDLGKPPGFSDYYEKRPFLAVPKSVIVSISIVSIVLVLGLASFLLLKTPSPKQDAFVEAPVDEPFVKESVDLAKQPANQAVLPQAGVAFTRSSDPALSQAASEGNSIDKLYEVSERNSYGSENADSENSSSLLSSRRDSNSSEYTTENVSPSREEKVRAIQTLYERQSTRSANSGLAVSKSASASKTEEAPELTSEISKTVQENDPQIASSLSEDKLAGIVIERLPDRDELEQTNSSTPPQLPNQQLSNAKQSTGEDSAAFSNQLRLKDFPEAVTIRALRESLQERIPTMRYTAHAYDAEPAFVVINKKQVKRGQQIVPGVRIHAITQDGLIAETEQGLIKMKALSSWINY